MSVFRGSGAQPGWEGDRMLHIPRLRLYPKMFPLLLQVLTVSDIGLSLNQDFSLQWL